MCVFEPRVVEFETKRRSSGSIGAKGGVEEDIQENPADRLVSVIRNEGTSILKHADAEPSHDHLDTAPSCDVTDRATRGAGGVLRWWVLIHHDLYDWVLIRF